MVQEILPLQTKAFFLTFSQLPKTIKQKVSSTLLHIPAVYSCFRPAPALHKFQHSENHVRKGDATEKIGPQFQQPAKNLLNTLYDDQNSIEREDGWCFRCRQNFSSFNILLQPASKRLQNNGPRICVGCTRIFGKYVNDDKMTCIIREQLLSSSNRFSNGMKEVATSHQFQHFHSSQYGNVPCTKEFEKLARKRRSSMKVRRYKQKFGPINGADDKVPSKSELINLFVKSNGICAISGITGVWTSDDPEDPFLLEVDHIKPLSKGGSYGKDNLQVILRCVNRLKGDQSNPETIEFLQNLKSNSLYIMQQNKIFSQLSNIYSRRS